MPTEPLPTDAQPSDDVPSEVEAARDKNDWGRQRRAAIARFGLASAVALVMFVATYLLFVATRTGQEIENLALRGAELRPDAERVAGLERLGVISVATFAIALGLVVVVGLLQGRPRIGLTVAGLMGGSVVLAEILKEILPRPALLEGPAWILRNSFPSGTAAVAVAVAIGAMVISPDRVRWIVVPVAIVYAAIVGEATQTTGWHRLSDTLGSAFLVVAVMAAGLAVLAALGEAERTTRGRIDPRIRIGLIVAAALTVTVAIAVLLASVAFPLLTAPSGGRRAFLQTALPLGGIGLTALVLIAFAGVIEPFTFGRRRVPSPAAPPPAGTNGQD
jgi:membrane-associated phospholipid phosphatase